MMAAALALTSQTGTCQARDTEASKRSTYTPAKRQDTTPIGKARLQFYSAPDRKCIIAGVFVIPGDRQTAYGEHVGYASVMYKNLKTGNDASGWIESAHLKSNATGISPRQ